MSEPEVIIRKEGRAGRLTLNRPQALNALTHGICLQTTQALHDWADDPEIAVIILDGAGERAFCAGGDIVQVTEAGKRGEYDVSRNFWRDEYRMNCLLADYAKPVVSFMHGFVMGGGVGYGCHTRNRIVGESTLIAMPECGIGMIPDVGGTWLLGQAPGELGTYLALTGARMEAGDAIHAGFADRFIPESDWDAVKAALAETGDLSVLPRLPDPASQMAIEQSRLNRLFAPSTVTEIIDNLRTDNSAIAQSALKAIRRNSPLSMACALAMLRPSPRSLDEALKQEYRWTWRSMEHADFIEGVRAQIIDKDRTPHWKHDDVADVTIAEVAAMLATLGRDELTFG